MKSCARCHAKLSIGRRISGDSLCENCKREIEEIREAELRNLQQALEPLSEDPLAAIAAVPTLVALDSPKELEPSKVHDVKVEAVNQMLDNMMTDGRLETWQFVVAAAVGKPLGLCQEPDWGDPRLLWKMRVGRTMAGSPFSGELPDSVAAQPDEVLHWSSEAEKLHEQIDREIEFDQRGATLDVTNRVSLEHGTLKGREVEVGRRMVADDRGRLYVTSRRIVYEGTRHSESIEGTGLLGTKVFADGIQIRTGGADEEPLFRISDPAETPMVAAAIAYMIRSAQGNPIRPDESQIPDFPRLDDHTERLIEAAGLLETQAREARLVGLTGGDPVEMFELRGSEKTDHREHPPSTSAAETKDPENDSSKPHGEGSNVQFRVTKTIWLDADGVQGLKPLGKFLLIEFEIRSSASHPVQMAAHEIRLVEEDGTQYEPWTGGAEDTLSFRRALENVFVYETLQPKLWHKGSLVYDVPAENFKLVRINLPSELS